VARSIPLVAAGLCLAALATAAPPPASSPEVQARERELAELRQQIDQLSAQLKQTEARASGLEGAIEKIGLQLGIQERRVAEADAERVLAEAKVTEAQNRLDESERNLEEERRRLEERMTGLYRVARHGHARLIFSIDPHADPLPAMRLLRYLARRDAESVEHFVQLGAELEKERADLEQRRAEAADWYRQQAERRDQLSQLELRQKALLAGVRQEEKQLAARAIELADRESKLAALLDSLYGRGDAPLAGRSMSEFKGLLDWPVRGRISAGFGPRRDPRYRTQVPHNGVDLETRAGDPVSAVYPGRVAFAAYFEGYGPTVVLQHAGKVYTLYAGLTALSVERGELVSLHQALGSAGTSLYFEIRVENKPEDPRRWIR